MRSRASIKPKRGEGWPSGPYGIQIDSHDVLKTLVDALTTTIDFLVMSDAQSKAQDSLKDSELIKQLKKISPLPADEKKSVVKMITDYIV